MEAFAARQLQKKKIAQEKLKKEQEQEDRRELDQQSIEEKERINVMLGFPPAPKAAFALGKDKCAAVWWTYEDENEGKGIIIGWEILRYRKDRSKTDSKWNYKGSNFFEKLNSHQVIITGLTNDTEYRFSVKAKNQKGLSCESPFSNGVVPESPLPSGWYRFYEKSVDKFYYANLRTNQSSWTRPELDPYFLEETIIFNFKFREISYLQEIYDDTIAHYEKITVKKFVELLTEVGEISMERWIKQLFRTYAKNDEDLMTWPQFMEVMNHIKKTRINSDIGFFTFLYSKVEVFFSRYRIKNILKAKQGRVRDWTILYNTVAERYYYKNKITGETYWTMPPQIRFYIPPKLEAKLLKVFDYGQLAEFQQYFCQLDVDNSGDLTINELKILFNALDIQISDSKLSRLMRSVDFNGSGTIEFDEYCWMMYEIFRKDKTSTWRQVTQSSSVLQHNDVPDNVSEVEFGASVILDDDDDFINTKNEENKSKTTNQFIKGSDLENEENVENNENENQIEATTTFNDISGMYSLDPGLIPKNQFNEKMTFSKVKEAFQKLRRKGEVPTKEKTKELIKNPANKSFFSILLNRKSNKVGTEEKKDLKSIDNSDLNSFLSKYDDRMKFDQNSNIGSAKYSQRILFEHSPTTRKGQFQASGRIRVEGLQSMGSVFSEMQSEFNSDFNKSEWGDDEEHEKYCFCGCRRF